MPEHFTQSQRKPRRAAGQSQTSISMADELLLAADRRAAELGLSRSLYIAQLIRRDITDDGDGLLIPKIRKSPRKSK